MRQTETQIMNGKESEGRWKQYAEMKTRSHKKGIQKTQEV